MAQKQTAEKIDKKTTGSNKEAMGCYTTVQPVKGDTFNNEVFSSTRIVVAPFITFLGFILMVPAIIYRGKKNSTSEQ